jgi:hypothetical protein
MSFTAGTAAARRHEEKPSLSLFLFMPRHTKYKIFNNLTTKAADLNCAGFSNGLKTLQQHMCTQKYVQQKGTKARRSSTTTTTTTTRCWMACIQTHKF